MNASTGPLTTVAAGRKPMRARAAVRDATEILVQLVAPMTPHLAEECWSVLGHDTLLSQTAWPKYDDALVVEGEVVLPVQINGKRAELTISRDAGQNAVGDAALRWSVEARPQRPGAEENHRGSAKDCEHCRLILLPSWRAAGDCAVLATTVLLTSCQVNRSIPRHRALPASCHPSPSRGDVACRAVRSRLIFLAARGAA